MGDVIIDEYANIKRDYYKLNHYRLSYYHAIMKIDIPPIYEPSFLKKHFLTLKKAKALFAEGKDIYAFTPVCGFSKQIIRVNTDYLHLYTMKNYILVDQSMIDAYRKYIDAMTRRIADAKAKLRRYRPISIDHLRIYYSDLSILLRWLRQKDAVLWNMISKTPHQFFLTIDDIHALSFDRKVTSLCIAEDGEELTTLRTIYRADTLAEWKDNIEERHSLPTITHHPKLDKPYINITAAYTRWLMSTVFVIEDYLMDILK